MQLSMTTIKQGLLGSLWRCSAFLVRPRSCLAAQALMPLSSTAAHPPWTHAGRPHQIAQAVKAEPGGMPAVAMLACACPCLKQAQGISSAWAGQVGVLQRFEGLTHCGLAHALQTC